MLSFMSSWSWMGLLLRLLGALIVVNIIRRGLGRTLVALGVFTVTIPLIILGKIIGLCTSKHAAEAHKRNTDLEQVEKNIYVAHGVANVGCGVCMTVVVGNGGKLAVFSPLAPQDHTLDQVRAIGNVDLIVLPSGGHDTHCLAWLKHFATARIGVPSTEQELITSALLARARKDGMSPPTIVASDDELKATYGITTLYPEEDTLHASMKEGVHLVPLSGNNRKRGDVALLFHDVQIDYRTSPKPMLFTDAMGWGPGHRTARFFQFMFVKNPPLLKKFLLEKVATIPNVQCLVFSHDRVLKSGQPGDLTAAIAAATESIVC